MSKLLRFSNTVLMILAAASHLPAQVTTGRIVGSVADPTGAVVPNAGITVVHQGTSESRRVRTNERGEFMVPYVRIGEYSITAETSGFRPETQTWYVESQQVYGFVDEITHFLDCVKTRQTPQCAAADAIKTHKLVFDILEQMKRHGRQL